jgi:hypothetical protein
LETLAEFAKAKKNIRMMLVTEMVEPVIEEAAII